MKEVKNFDSHETLLWYKEKYNISDYNRDLRYGNVDTLADFMYGRFYERYIEPFEAMNPEKKNGFSIMAIACLMIETLENFWQGSPETRRKEGSKYFESFFSRCAQINNELSKFKNLNFYHNIRCGILHQGETKDGWNISRLGSLLSQKTQTINATEFLSRLKDYLIWYRDELKASDFKKNKIWINFRKKMEFIKKNCSVENK